MFDNKYTFATAVRLTRSCVYVRERKVTRNCTCLYLNQNYTRVERLRKNKRSNSMIQIVHVRNRFRVMSRESRRVKAIVPLKMAI